MGGDSLFPSLLWLPKKKEGKELLLFRYNEITKISSVARASNKLAFHKLHIVFLHLIMLFTYLYKLQCFSYLGAEDFLLFFLGVTKEALSSAVAPAPPPSSSFFMLVLVVVLVLVLVGEVVTVAASTELEMVELALALALALEEEEMAAGPAFALPTRIFLAAASATTTAAPPVAAAGCWSRFEARGELCAAVRWGLWALSRDMAVGSFFLARGGLRFGERGGLWLGSRMEERGGLGWV